MIEEFEDMFKPCEHKRRSFGVCKDCKKEIVETWEEISKELKKPI